MIRNVRPCPRAPIGASWQAERGQFALPAPHAVRVTYAFYPLPVQPGDSVAPLATVQLDPQQHQFGGVWAWEAELDPALPQELAYVIWLSNADGTSGWITDPYARASTGGEVWGQPLGFRFAPNGHLLVEARTPGAFSGLRRLAVLPPPRSPAPRPARPHLPEEACVLYECHVRGMTQHPSSPAAPEHRGTFRGLTACIPHLKSLGVNVVELLPLFDFDEREVDRVHPETGESLFNYWGYSTLLFFAPKAAYAAEPHRAVEEFKEMVDAFHEAGMEVWLDVVYNHTAEMGADGPTDHFRLLGAPEWYLLDAEGRWQNHSGCGNTLHCAHPSARTLIRESLRYWVHEMGVDGFRFDLATILNRDSEGDLRGFPRMMWELKEDPWLKGVKLVSEPWDAGGGYQLGHGSWHANWLEWNDRFRDSIRQAVRGEEGQMQPLQQALLGSPAIFQGRTRGRQLSINFVTAHDGMTLADLTAYQSKHNLANGEDNRDGTHNDWSANCGVEGPSSDPEVQSLRLRRQCLFHLLLQLAHGLPMLVGGDEFARTQQGNNNAYCHDSELTWVNWEWTPDQRTLLQFVQTAIAFRQQHFEHLFGDDSEWSWWTAGNAPSEFLPHETTLVAEIRHPSAAPLRLLINTYHAPVEFFLPEGTRWQVHLASSPFLPKLPLESEVSRAVQVDASAAVVLQQRLA